MKRAEKPVRYGAHAIERLYQRGIAAEQVAQTVRYPDVVRPARRPGANRFERRFSARRRLVVIAEESLETIHVVSAFWIKPL